MDGWGGGEVREGSSLFNHICTVFELCCALQVSFMEQIGVELLTHVAIVHLYNKTIHEYVSIAIRLLAYNKTNTVRQIWTIHDVVVVVVFQLAVFLD